MLSTTKDSQKDSEYQDKTFIVKRMHLTFNDQECQVMNFIDVTVQRRLNQVQEKSEQLGTLSASVHHEMLGPLRSNVDFAETLVKHLRSPTMKKKAQLISISSKLVLFHANDLLDLRFLQTGHFSPTFSNGSVSQAITEIVELV